MFSHVIAVDVRIIREIRTDKLAVKCKGWGSKGSLEQAHAEANQSLCFVILYGSTFDLKQLCCIGSVAALIVDSFLCENDGFVANNIINCGPYTSAKQRRL